MEALAGGRRLSAREEELLGLLAGFPDGGGEYGSDRELSFSDLVEAGARPDRAPAPRKDQRGSADATPSSPGRHEAPSKQQQQQQAARDRRQRRRRPSSGGGRGSCGGSGDGVLLNFYVPGLLTRSMTAPRPGRGALPPAAVQGAPAKAAAAAAGKTRTQAPLGIGCWPALWGSRRDRRRPSAKACS